MKPKNRVLCPDCGKLKILFESESKANNFIRFNASEIPHGDRLRSYYCPACCGWHVSSHQYNGVNRTEIMIQRYRENKNRYYQNLKQERLNEILPLIHNISELLRDKNIVTKNELKRRLKEIKKKSWDERLLGHWGKVIIVCCEDLGITQDR